MELLQAPEDGGHPDDYIFARIRGRRAMLAGYRQVHRRGAAPPTAGEEGKEWAAFLREANWIFRSMDGGLYRTLTPLFRYLELRTLMLCLRFRAAGGETEIDELLAFSLLSPRVKEVLRVSPDSTAAVGAVERILVAADPSFRGLRELYAREGPGVFEQTLTDRFFRDTIAEVRHPVLRRFFGDLVDMRNLLALYKHLRWQIKATPAFLAGGRIAPRVLERLVERQDLPGLLRLAGRLTGREPATGEEFEGVLLDGLTRRLRREGRNPLAIGLVLDYLWRWQLEARNRRLSGGAEEPGPEVTG